MVPVTSTRSGTPLMSAGKLHAGFDGFAQVELDGVLSTDPSDADPGKSWPIS